jgi:hypothetical protein
MLAESGWRCRFDGQLEEGWHEVYSDRPIGDVLVFARPVPAAGKLFLTIDADSYGGSGTITFEVPKSLWNRN